MSAAPTSASGGSARSQADSLDRHAWEPRPWASRGIRAVMIAIPLAAAWLIVRVLTMVVSRPDSTWLVIVWAALLMVASLVAGAGAGQLARRLAPLSALLKLSLVFPDAAPSRFRAALRAGTGRTLARRVTAAQVTGDSRQAAAERAVELLAALSRHDRLTRGHSERVRAYAVMLGEEIGLSEGDLDMLNWASLMHDIGKLHVPAEILGKAGRPTDEEWTILRQHPAASVAMLDQLRPWLGEWVHAADQHHERFDGGGYPMGLAGKDISLAGRIVSLCDAFDVMTATRSYKAALPAAQARAELQRNAGTQFDPALVRSFLSISLGKTQSAAGPLGWLAQLPELLRAPVTAAMNSATGVAAAGVATIAVTTATIAPLPAPVADEAAASATAPPTVVAEDEVERDPTGAVATTTRVPDAASIPESTVGLPPQDAPRAGSSTTSLGPTTTIVVTTTTAASTSTTIPLPTTTVNKGLFPMDAKDDDYVTEETELWIWPLVNDDFGGALPDLSTFRITVPPRFGTATAYPTGVIHFVLTEASSDVLTYRICNIAGNCDTATVTMVVSG